MKGHINKPLITPVNGNEHYSIEISLEQMNDLRADMGLPPISPAAWDAFAEPSNG